METRTLTRAATISTLDEATRTVEVVWSTGARVLRGFYDRFWEELSLDPKHVRMDRLQSGRAPLLDSHDARSVLGVVESARLEKGQGVARVRFAKDDPAADRAWNLVRQSVLRNVSVGYQVHRFEKVEVAGDKIPVQRATDWEPYELSLVAMGADATAHFRANTEEHRMENENPTTNPTNTPDAGELVAREERERVEAVRKLVATAKLEPSFAQQLVTRGATLEQARSAVLDVLATRDEAFDTVSHQREPTLEVGATDREKFMRAAEAAILARAGCQRLVATAAKTEDGKTLADVAATDPSGLRGFSLVDLARECLERSGVKTRGMRPTRVVEAALSHRSSGMATTSDFAVLLEGALNKVLLASYATQPTTWQKFAGRKTVTDFREHKFYRNGSFGTLDKVNEAGEFKNKAIPDGERSTLQASTKGNIIAISRQTLVNDDLGAFNDLAQRFGAMAARSIELDVYALLLENAGLGPTFGAAPLFDATHGNVGVGAALSVESIDKDAQLLGEQKDPSGNDFLDLRPAVLLVPRALEGAAKVINGAEYDPDTSGKLQRPNMVRGLFREIVGTPRLTGTRRYLFADPAIAPALAVAFLEGEEAPVFQTREGWRVDGTEMKLRQDYGVGAVDYRGAVTNSGVAEGG